MKIPPSSDLLSFSEAVCREYRAKGYAITLRQLYYQGVSRRVLPSSDDAYTALMRTLSKARLDGKFPLWALVDRTRVVRPGRFTRCDTRVDRALLRSAEAARLSPERFLHRDRWFGQPNHVSVWFEKEALAGIFETACDELDVSWFSCRGDPSHPSLYQWLQRAAEAHGVDNPEGWKDARGDSHRGLARKSVVLYFGDCDPTGMRIPRTAEETLRTFARIAGLTFDLEFVRVGLSVKQARELDLPSFVAKKSAGKDYDDYVRDFDTDEAWELDALSPETLEGMVQDSVGALFDSSLHERLQRDVERRRGEMRVGMRSPDWHATATAEMD